MNRYVRIWNWIALALAVVYLAVGSGKAGAGTLLLSIAPFGLALTARYFVENSLFCLLVRLANGLFALLFAARLLKYVDYGILTANMGFMAFLFVILPLLNVIYLTPRDG